MKVSKTLFFISLFVFSLFVFGHTDVQAEVTVYDADEQFLGIFNGYERGADIYIPSADINVLISFDHGDASPGVFIPLYYESSNCSGDAYIGPNASYYVYKVVDKYYSGQRVTPMIIQFISRVQSDGFCKTLGSSYPITAVPAHEITLPFTLPVALPLSFKIEKVKKPNKHEHDHDKDDD